MICKEEIATKKDQKTQTWKEEAGWYDTVGVRRTKENSKLVAKTEKECEWDGKAGEGTIIKEL